MGEAASLRLAARAQINLYLHVVGRRDDGYHLLDSLVCFAELGDELAIAPAEELSLEIDGPFGPVLAGGDNLVLAAARLLDAKKGAALRLTKQLPVAAGIGGGSADAAAALVGLCRLRDCPMPEASRLLSLGADLPVCLSQGPSFVGGIGEEIAPAPALPRAYLLLVNPRRPLPTPQVFRGFSGPFSKPARWHEPPADAAALAGMLAERSNDLTGPAMAVLPEIADLLDAIHAAPGCLLARMSGSGATCFGLFAEAEEVAKAAAAIQATQPLWWVRATAIAAGGAVGELSSAIAPIA
jgi:4-diphosphocytidyl-2-C-methyl-D-erythritol kinase